MDGSIATSASVRLREQLRGAFHAPTGSADAGLFEELLRMPVLQQRSEPKADAPGTDADPDADADLLAEAAAAKANEKASTKPPRDKEDEAEEPPADEAKVESVDAVAVVQPVLAQASTVEAPPQPAEKVATTANDTTTPARAIASNQATTNQQPSEDNHDATAVVVEQPVPAGDAPPPLAQGTEQAQVVDAAPETPTAPAVESTLTEDQAPVQAAAATEDDAAGFDQAPHRSAEVKSSNREENKPQNVPVAAPVQAPPQPESKAPAEPHDQPRSPSAAQTDFQTNAQQVQTPRDEPAVRDDDTGDRREKWFARDDDPLRAEDAETLGKPDLEQTLLDPAAPTANSADSVSALGPSDTLTLPGDVAATDAVQPSATIDATAIASALAQQNVVGSGSGSGGSAQGDSRGATQSVGGVTGGPTTSSSTARTSAAGRPERDQDGIAGASQQERVRLVQRVARSFSRLGPDGGQVTLKLHPPQLGVLNMSVRIEGQTMTARLHTETTGARDAILENLPMLRERLAEQGIEVESFQVEVASDRNLADQQSQSQAQNPFGGDSSGDWRGGARNVDYRRLSRSSSDVPGPADGSTRGVGPARWSPHSPLERTLDIRA